MTPQADMLDINPPVQKISAAEELAAFERQHGAQIAAYELGSSSSDFNTFVSAGDHERAFEAKQRYDDAARRHAGFISEVRHVANNYGKYISPGDMAAVRGMMPESMTAVASVYDDRNNKLFYRGRGSTEAQADLLQRQAANLIEPGSMEYYKAAYTSEQLLVDEKGSSFTNPFEVESKANRLQTIANVAMASLPGPTSERAPNADPNGPALPDTMRNKLAWDIASTSDTLTVSPDIVGGAVRTFANSFMGSMGANSETAYAKANEVTAAMGRIAKDDPNAALAAGFVVELAATDPEAVGYIKTPEQMALAVKTIGEQVNTAVAVINRTEGLDDQKKKKGLIQEAILLSAGNVFSINDPERSKRVSEVAMSGAETALDLVGVHMTSATPEKEAEATAFSRSVLREAGVEEADIDTIVGGIRRIDAGTDIPQAYKQLPGVGSAQGQEALAAMSLYQNFDSQESLGAAFAYLNAASADYQAALKNPNTTEADRVKIREEITKIDTLSKHLNAQVANQDAAQSVVSPEATMLDSLTQMGIAPGSREADRFAADMEAARTALRDKSRSFLEISPSRVFRAAARKELGAVSLTDLGIEGQGTLFDLLGPATLSEVQAAVNVVREETFPSGVVSTQSKLSASHVATTDALFTELENRGLIHVALRDNAKKEKGSARFKYVAVPQAATALPRGTVMMGSQVLNTPEQLVSYMAGGQPTVDATGAPTNPFAELRRSAATRETNKQELQDALDRNEKALTSKRSSVGSPEAKAYASIVRLSMTDDEHKRDREERAATLAWNRDMRKEQVRAAERAKARAEYLADSRHSDRKSVGKFILSMDEDEVERFGPGAQDSFDALSPVIFDFMLRTAAPEDSEE